MQKIFLIFEKIFENIEKLLKNKKRRRPFLEIDAVNFIVSY